MNELLVNRALSILELPYFKSLDTMGIDDIDTQKLILSKLFNEDVIVGNYSIYNSNGNLIYSEDSDGDWEKYGYDTNGKEIYREYSDGYWVKYGYDMNGNIIYYENSDGIIRDYRSNNNINESKDRQELFVNRVLSILDKPYFKSLDSMGIDNKNTQKLIFSKLFNDNISIGDNTIHNSNGNLIYSEYYDGGWFKQEYDSNGNIIYYEDSNGGWSKQEYDSNDNIIYSEYSDGYWVKKEYDSNGNQIYYENSDGEWYKHEYDSNGNQIYYEDYDGTIYDYRTNNNINESEDRQELLVNRALSILDKPYFKSLDTMGIDDKNTQELILSTLFNDNISIGDNTIHDSNGNLIYSEYYEYGWFKQEYDSNGNIIYYEDSNGGWEKYGYDTNGNEIYREYSDGYWVKKEYDSNGNQIYYENSDGVWSKREYDSNGNSIYYENSDGIIYDYRTNNNINESEDRLELFVNRVLSILELPYFKSLETIGIDDVDTQKLIFSKLFNDDVSIKYNDDHLNIYNSNGNEIYYEDSDGEWSKHEYDSNGKEIYYEYSDGYWEKREYDSNGNEIYREYSNGDWVKQEYDINGYQIYYERYDGVWYKSEYDSNGNEIYFENSDGYWEKREYDSNGNLIYSEHSDGTIYDNRSGSNNINESEDRQELFINRVLSILELPYFKSLDSMGIDDKNTQKLIFSKLFNDYVIIDDGYIYDSNDNSIYYEDSDGYWSKSEYDSNGNIIYHKNSDGDWNKREYDINGNEVYFEDSDGFWSKHEYDSNDNIIYYEDSDGEWGKSEYDTNRNKIYFENSDGYWVKQEYDSNGNSIYYETSNGIIHDNRPGDNINESLDKQELFVNRVLSILELPYFKSLDSMGIDDKGTRKLIFSKLFNDDVIMGNNTIYNSNGKEIYYEYFDGSWVREEYDSNGNVIYYEDSYGYIRHYKPSNNINESEDRQELFINRVLSILDKPYFKSLDSIGIDDIDTQKLIFSKLFNDNVSIENNKIYNSNGNQIYYEDSDGYWSKREYDSNGNIIYFEDSDGDWVKYEYDSNGNSIYYETSNGVWSKQEYDSDGNSIYYETSNGIIHDNRSGNINESEDRQELFLNRTLSILDKPYFKSLDSIGIDDIDTQKLIFSKLFNDNVSIKYNHDYLNIYDSNGNIIYYEDSSGVWSKYEYDINGNVIYFENSDGYWKN